MGTVPLANLHRKVLLVEDDGEFRVLLSEALERHGHEVVAVGDGHEALRLMRAIHPDIVLLDLMLPGMNGWEFRIEQRRDPALAETPVVVMSGEHGATAAAVDADIYLAKPCSERMVLEAIDQVMRERDRRLQPARVAQAERMAALGTLAAGVAHEINNPLTYVRLHLGTLAKELPRLITDDNRAAIERLAHLVDGALEGVERIREVTAGIREMSRTDERIRELVDVRRPLESALRMLSNQLRHRARVVTQLRAVPLVLAAEGRLGQVFLNLLTNAMQAIPEEPDAAEELVTVVTRTDEAGRVVIEITDTGVGIPVHQIGHVFEPFFTSKAVGQGTGLGLSISHGIVRALGGAIEVTSEPGVGSTFRVLLPPASAPPPRARGTQPPGAAAPRRRVLVIDDEPAIGEGLRRAIGEEHDVDVATGGRKGLDMMLRGDHDVVLCDLHMPDLSGMELYRRLLEIRPKLVDRLVFITAGAFTDQARQVVASSNRPCLDKPLDLEALRSLLSRWPA